MYIYIICNCFNILLHLSRLRTLIYNYESNLCTAKLLMMILLIIMTINANDNDNNSCGA